MTSDPVSVCYIYSTHTHTLSSHWSSSTKARCWLERKEEEEEEEEKKKNVWEQEISVDLLFSAERERESDEEHGGEEEVAAIHVTLNYWRKDVVSLWVYMPGSEEEART